MRTWGRHKRLWNDAAKKRRGVVYQGKVPQQIQMNAKIHLNGFKALLFSYNIIIESKQFK